MEKQRKKTGIIVLQILILILIGIGLFRVQDYGLSFDEPYEYETTKITCEYMSTTLAQIFRGEEIRDIVGYLDYRDNVYGAAVRIPVFFLFQNATIRIQYLALHYYTFLWYILAAFAMYGILRNISFGRTEASFGMLMYLVMPRFMAEACYNIKDIMFLSVFTLVLYLGTLLVEKCTVGRLIVYSFFLALCANTRYMGAVVVLPLLAGLLVFHKTGRAFGKFALITALSLFFYYLMTPYLWLDPFRNAVGIVLSFTNNEERAVSLLFAGQEIVSDALPWNYLLLWMGISIPLWILLAFLIGIVRGSTCLFRRFSKSRRSVYLICTGGMFGGIVITDIILRTMKYDGWRHFYFIYALLVPVAVWGVKYVLDTAHNRFRMAVVSLCLLSFLGDMSWGVFRHPYEMVYLNPVGMLWADGFETDYWKVSMTSAIRRILANETGTVKVWLGWDTGTSLLTEEELARVEVVENFQEADYLVVYERTYRWSGITPGELPGYVVWEEKYIGKGLIYQILIPAGKH